MASSMNGHKILSSAAIAAERQRVTRRRREIRRRDRHGWLSVAFPLPMAMRNM
jgi:hypothetical protein